MPDRHHPPDDHRKHQRHPAAVGDLHAVGRDERKVDYAKAPGHQPGQRQVPAPDLAHGDEQQDRGQRHRQRHRDAIGRGQVVGLPEPERQPDGDDHQQPIDGADIDLAVALARGLRDPHPRAPAELDRLPRHGERAGDDRLAGDHRGERRQDDQRQQQRRRAQAVEDVAAGRRAVQQQPGLAGVVQHQRRQHQAEPGEADGPRADMPHVGIQRLGAGHAQEHAAEHQEPARPAVHQREDGIAGIEPGQHRGVLDDAIDAERPDGHEPQRHHRAEQPADPRRPQRLDREQAQQHRDCRRQNVGGDRGRGEFQALQRRQYGDRRGDGAITVDQRRAEQPDRDDHRPLRLLDAKQRHQRENAALAVVVHAHHEGHIFDAGDDDQRPDQQGQQAQHGVRAGRAACQFDDGLERVERAGADIAEHHADRGQRKRGQVPGWLTGCGAGRVPCSVRSLIVGRRLVRH